MNMAEKKSKEVNVKYDKLIDISLRKSLFYPAAEIYPGAPAGFWDFGPIGQSIRRKVVDFWRHEMVQKENMFEIHGAQILPESVFLGSGHLKSFADPIVSCLKCKKYERADRLISDIIKENVPESLAIEKLDDLITKNKIKCPKCKGELGKVSKFNMMVESIVGKQGEFKTFLRPEACQSIFLNFSRMVKTMRVRLPCGLAQVGGVFRNEISPRQSITRAIEFAQMDMEVFFDPNNIDVVENFDEISDYKVNILRLGKENMESFSASELVSKKIVPGKIIAYYLAKTQQLWNKLGIPIDNLRFREVDKDERAFYSLATFDFEALTCIGWLELIANNYRTDYDLKGHMNQSKTNLEYVDDKGKRFIPHIWEISAGVDRTMFAILDNNLREGKDGSYLALPNLLAPYQACVFPIVNKEGMPELAVSVKKMLENDWFDVVFDDSGSVGRRYARADEIGVPYCITIDGDSASNQDVTIRDRDSTKQIRVKISDLNMVLRNLIYGRVSFEKAGKLVERK